MLGLEAFILKDTLGSFGAMDKRTCRQTFLWPVGCPRLTWKKPKGSRDHLTRLKAHGRPRRSWRAAWGRRGGGGWLGKGFYDWLVLEDRSSGDGLNSCWCLSRRNPNNRIPGAFWQITQMGFQEPPPLCGGHPPPFEQQTCFQVSGVMKWHSRFHWH